MAVCQNSSVSGGMSDVSMVSSGRFFRAWTSELNAADGLGGWDWSNSKSTSFLVTSGSFLWERLCSSWFAFIVVGFGKMDCFARARNDGWRGTMTGS